MLTGSALAFEGDDESPKMSPAAGLSSKVTVGDCAAVGFPWTGVVPASHSKIQMFSNSK